MKVLGITGGVGAGKSTVLAYLEKKYQAAILQADETARGLQQKGQPCYEEIRAWFGEAILQKDGEIDRPALAKIVFSDAAQLKKLNEIVHPAVRQRILQEIQEKAEKGSCRLLVLEAALLLEEGYDAFCDSVWYIHTDRKVREKRLMESRGYSQARVRDMMSSQLSEDEYRKKCKNIIDNSSNIVENTYEQIDKGLIRDGIL